MCCPAMGNQSYEVEIFFIQSVIIRFLGTLEYVWRKGFNPAHEIGFTSAAFEAVWTNSVSVVVEWSDCCRQLPNSKEAIISGIVF